MKPKYLARNGVFRIANLFLDTCNRDRLQDAIKGVDLPEYVLGPDDWTCPLGIEYKSMSKIFLEFGDVTGYDFAIEVLGSYEHFLQLSQHKLIGKYIRRWQNELKAKIDSFAIKAIQDITTNSGTQVQLSAAKYLANRQYEERNPVGKPATNNKYRKEETNIRHVAKDTAEELERLGIPLN